MLSLWWCKLFLCKQIVHRVMVCWCIPSIYLKLILDAPVHCLYIKHAGLSQKNGMKWHKVSFSITIKENLWINFLFGYLSCKCLRKFRLNTHSRALWTNAFLPPFHVLCTWLISLLTHASCWISYQPRWSKNKRNTCDEMFSLRCWRINDDAFF